MSNLGYIPLFFMFLPAFSILVGKKAILLFFIITVIYFIITFLLSPQYFCHHLIRLYKKTTFKYFVYWFIWVIISGLILIIVGKYTISHYIYYFYMYLLVNMTLTLLLPTLMLKKYKSVNTIIKFIFSLIYLILLLGIINFIGAKYKIDFLQNFFTFIVNQRALVSVAAKDMSGIRVYSVFAEPGFFGGFITLFLPIVYFLSKSKYKIYKNVYLNLIFIKTIIPLSFINIILTKSPIWLLLFILVFVVLKFKELKNKNILHIITTTFFLVLIMSTLIFAINSNGDNINNKYLSRITETFQSVINMDYEYFVNTEPSLATRVTSYINSLRLFLKYPITGVGLGNSKFYMSSMFESSPVPLSSENLSCLMSSYTKKTLSFNGAFFYELLSETGIIGYILFIYFIYKTHKVLKSITNTFTGIQYNFIKGLSNTVFLLFIFQFYDFGFVFLSIWFVLGLAISFINLQKQTFIAKDYYD